VRLLCIDQFKIENKPIEIKKSFGLFFCGCVSRFFLNQSVNLICIKGLKKIQKKKKKLKILLIWILLKRTIINNFIFSSKILRQNNWKKSFMNPKTMKKLVLFWRKLIF